MTGINSLFYVTSSIPPWWLTDLAGRRPILLCGSIAMALALTATGYWIYIDQAITPNAGEFMTCSETPKLTFQSSSVSWSTTLHSA